MNRKIVLFTCAVVLSSLVRFAIAQEIAPDFTLNDIDGVGFSLSDYRGKVVLLDFCATWCSPCLAEIPHLKSLHEEFGEDLIIILISVSPSYDTVEKLQQFRQEHDIDWIIARDTIGMNEEYYIQYIPTLVIIDQEGYIRHRHVGLTDESVLRQEIYEIILQPITPAIVDIDPNSLNLKSSGSWITAYIELQESYSVGDIDVSTIILNDTVPVDSEAPTEIGDYDNDGILDLMVKFDRAEVMALLSVGEATLTITGKVNVTTFEGTDIIRVIGK